jgi:hypothetical protein
MEVTPPATTVESNLRRFSKFLEFITRFPQNIFVYF